MDLERVSLEPLALVRHRVRRIRGIREELVNSQSTGTSSSTRNRTDEVVRLGSGAGGQLLRARPQALPASDQISPSSTPISCP